MNFDQAFEKLMVHEGGYVSHPSDPGGETNHGITAYTARVNGYIGAMRDLPLATAKQIAKREYWDAVNADQLPEAVRFAVFDAAYNSGPKRAIKWLQQAVYVDPDGKFGANTLMGVQTYRAESIASRYSGHRLQFMTDLNTWASFGKGWSRRIASNLIATKG